MWTYNYNELYHHGVKGMKWGVRRYQNKDGSLTSAGKKRKKINYAEEAKNMTDKELRSQVDRLALEKRYSSLSGGGRRRDLTDTISNVASSTSRDAINLAKQTTKDKTTNAALNVAGSGIDIASKGYSTAKRISNVALGSKKARDDRATLSTMSDSDLRKRVERMDLEQRYAGLKTESVSRGKASVGEILGIVGGVVGVGVGVAGLALEIYKLRKGKGQK